MRNGNLIMTPPNPTTPATPGPNQPRPRVSSRGTLPVHPSPLFRLSLAAGLALLATLPATRANESEPPPAPLPPPTRQTLEAEAARQARYEATLAEMARLRAQRPKTSGLLPPPPLNQAGEVAPEQPPPADLAEVEARRAARAARARFTHDQVTALLEAPGRQPETIRKAAPDDVRLLRARFAREEAGVRADRASRPPRAGEPTPLEEIVAARAEIVRRAGLTGRLPPAPTGPPPGAVATPEPHRGMIPPVRSP